MTDVLALLADLDRLARGEMTVEDPENIAVGAQDALAEQADTIRRVRDLCRHLTAQGVTIVGVTDVLAALDQPEDGQR